jgi:hypothetical protein
LGGSRDEDSHLNRVTLGLLVLSVVILVTVLGSIAIMSSDGKSEAQPVSATSTVKKPVKVIARATDSAKEEVTDGGIAGVGVFRATGAFTDHGTTVVYRWLSALDQRVIFLRFVMAGEDGAITYHVRIDTARRPVISRWTIKSGTEAYKGLQGNGTESENATFTVSTFRGKVWH